MVDVVAVREDLIDHHTNVERENCDVLISLTVVSLADGPLANIVLSTKLPVLLASHCMVPPFSIRAPVNNVSRGTLEGHTGSKC